MAGGRRGETRVLARHVPGDGRSGHLQRPRSPRGTTSPRPTRARAARWRSSWSSRRARRQSLRAQGVNVQLQKNELGLTAQRVRGAAGLDRLQRLARLRRAGRLRAQLYDIAKQNPRHREARGHRPHDPGPGDPRPQADQGRGDIARRQAPGRPLQRACSTRASGSRGEVNIRLLHWYIDQYRANDKEIKKLLKTTELWFVPVANPDGYQYTFESPDTRLWRKNLRDNNGNGTIESATASIRTGTTPSTGTTTRRARPTSSRATPIAAPVPASEPETRAIKRLLDADRLLVPGQLPLVRPVAPLPGGLADQRRRAPTTRSTSPSRATSTTRRFEGFEPGAQLGVLYVTNGEIDRLRPREREARSPGHPSSSEGCEGCGFVFPDDEALVQAEFEKNLPFALDVAKSAKDPDDPVSHLGIETKPFYLKSDDTVQGGAARSPTSRSTSPTATRRRCASSRSGASATSSVKYRINGGRVRSDDTREWRGGETLRRARPTSTTTSSRAWSGARSPATPSRCWFESKKAKSDSFTYTAAVESRNKVLILSAEDYTGASPAHPGRDRRRRYLSYYEDALAANGIGYDVYDVDANGRKAPTPLGVLSHYKAVVWYTGDDIITREPGWAGGQHVPPRHGRDARMPATTSTRAARCSTPASTPASSTRPTPAQLYDPTSRTSSASRRNPRRTTAGRARPLLRRPRARRRDRVLVRGLPAQLRRRDSTRRRQCRSASSGSDTPFDSLSLVVQRRRQRAEPVQRELVHHDERDPARARLYPQFESWSVDEVRPPGRAVRPAQRRELRVLADRRRLLQAADADDRRPGRRRRRSRSGRRTTPRRSGTYLFVEAHHLGPGRLDDAPGHERAHDQSTGQSCPAAGTAAPVARPLPDDHERHDCDPTGTTGTGTPPRATRAGWQEWSIDLAAYAGGRSRSRSATPATGRPRVSASSSTT